MRDFRPNNTIRLKENARPIGTVTADHFKENIEDGIYWGVPSEYFHIEGEKVYLDNRLASKLEWTVDGVMPDMLNIAALPDKIDVDGDSISVNPGFWCSNVPKEDVLD